MKVTCLLGSPRENGNSAAIAKRFCDAAIRYGAEVQTYSLNKLKYRGCQACMVCKTRLDRCALDDDLSQVLEAVRDADILVLASPVYYGDISSQLKGFIDRTFSYLLPDYRTNPMRSRLAHGKKLVFVLAQGNPDQGQFADISSRYGFFYEWYGFAETHCIRACGVSDAGEVLQQPDVLEEAEQLAKGMLNAE